MNRVTLIVLFVTMGVAQMSARELTDKGGRVIDAEIISVQGDQVNIRRTDGQKFSIRIDSLSLEDQTFVRSWRPEGSPQPR